MTFLIRSAVEADRSSVESLVSHQARAGAVLPRQFVPSDFLVAEWDGDVRGTIATSSWGWGVMELGTVISTVPRSGMGAALVRAGLGRVVASGQPWAVVLTSLPGYFAQYGFSPVETTPWARAKSPVMASALRPSLDRAIGEKAASSCSGCARLSTCRQQLMVLRLDARSRVCA